VYTCAQACNAVRPQINETYRECHTCMLSSSPVSASSAAAYPFANHSYASHCRFTTRGLCPHWFCVLRSHTHTRLLVLLLSLGPSGWAATAAQQEAPTAAAQGLSGSHSRPRPALTPTTRPHSSSSSCWHACLAGCRGNTNSSRWPPQACHLCTPPEGHHTIRQLRPEGR
jgi:hypothetical protein